MIIKIEREDLEVFSFVFGVVFGSFLNVLIYRLPKQISILKPSFCPNCGSKIKYFENIPLISYIFLKAKCATCKNKIPFRYFLVELITGFLTLFLFLQVSLSFEFFYLIILFYTLIVLSFIDIKYKAVPDYLLLIALIVAFFATKDEFLVSLENACIFAGFFVLLEFIITFYIQNIKAKLIKDDTLRNTKALGEGDIPIIAIIGAVLGIKAGVIAIFLAGIFAIIPSILNTLLKKDSQIPFIPFLVMGFLFEFFINISSKVFT